MTALPARADGCLRLAIPTSDRYLQPLIDNFQQAIRGSGICASVARMPAKRATALMLRGLLDGELGRIDSYGEVVGDSALRVPVPLISGKGYMLSRDPALTSPARLGDHSLGVISGIRWQMEVAARVRNVTMAPDLPRLAELLRRGRVDAALINGLSLQRGGLGLENFHRSEVYAANIYLWLARRHEALVPRLRRSLERHIARHGSMQADLSKPGS